MRKIVKYVSSSTQKSQSFLKSQSTSVPLGLIKEFEIRWNTVYDMLLRAHSLREAMDKWIDQEIAGAKTTAKRKIECLRLSLREWNHIEGLIKLLEPFKKITVAVSKAKEPMLNVALNVYNNLFEHLQHFISKYTAYSGIRGELKSAIESGLKKLQKSSTKPMAQAAFFLTLPQSLIQHSNCRYTMPMQAGRLVTQLNSNGISALIITPCRTNLYNLKVRKLKVSVP